MICQSSKRNWSYGASSKEAQRSCLPPATASSHPTHSDSLMTYDWLNRQTSWSDGKKTEMQVYRGAEWKRIATLVEKADGGRDTVKYLYDGDNVIGDYDASGVRQVYYVTPGLDSNLSMTNACHTKYTDPDAKQQIEPMYIKLSTNQLLKNADTYAAMIVEEF